MKLKTCDVSKDIASLKALAQGVFEGEDANIDEWFSFPEMIRSIELDQGCCIEAVSDEDELLGFVYAQQESPINGLEGRQKWVILIAAVKSGSSGRGVGSSLLSQVEKYAASKGAIKMFVYTNQGDTQVINFYKNNGFSEAGTIKDYQYGQNNSADFLLKYL